MSGGVWGVGVSDGVWEVGVSGGVWRVGGRGRHACVAQQTSSDPTMVSHLLSWSHQTLCC